MEEQSFPNPYNLHPMRQVAFLLFLLISAAALACSGPGAHAEMVNITLASRWQFALTVGAFLASLAMVAKGIRHHIAVVALFVLAGSHPSLWLSAYGGDCGGRLEMFTFGYSVATAGFLVWHIRSALMAKSRSVQNSP